MLAVILALSRIDVPSNGIGGKIIVFSWPPFPVPGPKINSIALLGGEKLNGAHIAFVGGVSSGKGSTKNHRQVELRRFCYLPVRSWLPGA